MKIIQINTVCGHGSTGSIAVDIATGLRKKGDKCYIAYGQGSSNYSDSYKIGGWLENKWHGLFRHLNAAFANIDILHILYPPCQQCSPQWEPSF